VFDNAYHGAWYHALRPGGRASRLSMMPIIAQFTNAS
jgi:hypothetical protein